MINSLRFVTLTVGLIFVATAMAISSHWYFALPLPPGIEDFPLTGVALFKTAFLIEGALLLLLGITGWNFHQIPPHERLQIDAYGRAPPGFACLAAISAITLLAAFLRIYGLSQSFWLDEVVTLGYSVASLSDQLTVFVGSNNHLLNTLLIKGSVAVFGEYEWSVRLPAVVFGIATVPALYWLTRRPLGDWPALAACLLLAVSYHHIFFSQNARGYTAYIFFSVLATGFFLRALRQDRASHWLCYIAVMFLSFTALLNSAFVLLSHVAVGALGLCLAARRGANVWPSVRRLGFVFFTLGILVFHLYAILIPQIYVVLTAVYTEAATGFSPFTMEFVQELVGGVSAGFAGGALIAAVPFMLVAASGFISLFRKDYLLTLMLLFPGLFTGMYLVAKGLTVSPRFFLFELILALICAVCGVLVAASWLAEKKRFAQLKPAVISSTAILLLAVISLASLLNYYATPKQGFREAVEYVEQIRSDSSRVIVLYTAQFGIAHYENALARDSEVNRYSYIRDIDTFKAALADEQEQSTVVVTTFPRALAIDQPELSAEMSSHWRIVKTFPATIGDGEIYIWRRK